MATRKRYTVEFKIEVINYAKKHGNLPAGRKFNIDESMARSWRKKENLLRASDKSRRSIRGLSSKYPLLDKKVVEWLLSQRALRGTVTIKEVRKKAVQISKELGIEGFTGTSTWYYRFLRREKINTDKLNWNTKVFKWKPRNVKKEPTTSNSKIVDTTPSSSDSTSTRISSIQSRRPKNVSTQTRIAVTPTNSSKQQQQQSSINGRALNIQLESFVCSESPLPLGSDGTSVGNGPENIETISPGQSQTYSDPADEEIAVSDPQRTSLSPGLENNINISDFSIFSSPDRLFFSSICMDMKRLPFKEKLRFKRSVLRLLHERLLRCEES